MWRRTRQGAAPASQPKNDEALELCSLAQPSLARGEGHRLAQGDRLREVNLRGLVKVDWIFVFSCAAHNLLRLAPLIATQIQQEAQPQCA